MIKRFFKFGLVGGLGTVINLVIFALLSFAGVNYMISSVIAFIIAPTSNYILNSIYVFDDRGHKRTKILWIKFMSVSVFSLGINLIILFIMENYIMPYIIKYWLINEIMQITADILNNDLANFIIILLNLLRF